MVKVREEQARGGGINGDRRESLLIILNTFNNKDTFLNKTFPCNRLLIFCYFLLYVGYLHELSI